MSILILILVCFVAPQNRAFDHMLGYFPGVDGLKGDEFNLVNTSDPSSERVTVDNTSPYVGPFDPDHSTPATTDKIFGKDCLAKGCDTPTMSGFVEFESARHGLEPSKSVMNMFTPDRVPIMSTLASEFAVFDRFFCSHPGPTWPNRLFQLMGSSKGDTETSKWDVNSTLYTGRTIFDNVEEAGHDWKFYYADAPLEMAMIEKLTFHPGKIHGWDRFKKDIREGDLPAFSWVNPRWFINMTSLEGANDQHPDHDVRLGEALMKEMYEELRASPKWNSTLFIITYDEVCLDGWMDGMCMQCNAMQCNADGVEWSGVEWRCDFVEIFGLWFVLWSTVRCGVVWCVSGVWTRLLATCVCVCFVLALALALTLTLTLALA